MVNLREAMQLDNAYDSRRVFNLLNSCSGKIHNYSTSHRDVFEMVSQINFMTEIGKLEGAKLMVGYNCDERSKFAGLIGKVLDKCSNVVKSGNEYFAFVNNKKRRVELMDETHFDIITDKEGSRHLKLNKLGALKEEMNKTENITMIRLDDLIHRNI